MLQLGIMGYGAIGKDVWKALSDGTITGIQCPAFLVKTPRDSQPSNAPPLTANPDQFFSHPYDVVLEVAGHKAIQDHAVRSLEHGADIMVTSVGAFSDSALLERVMDAARANGRRVILPSAGVGSLDMLTAAAQGGLDEVLMIVTKDAESWKGTQAEEMVDLDNLKAPVVLYEGPARGGAAAYPQNVNISAAVSLAGLGLDNTRLRIIADPTPCPHIIEIEAKGRFGRYYFKEEATPSPDNRKTGLIVAMAVIKTLRQLTSPLVIGG